MAATSAPGKILLVGGYLVLQPENPGLVLGLPARIYAIVDKSASAGAIVSSPQFLEAKWEYSVNMIEGMFTVEERFAVCINIVTNRLDTIR